MQRHTPVDEIRALIRPERVHRRIYTDPDIFELEMERIFGRTWLFIAHESQLKKPGDFVRSRLGRYDLVVTRHTDGRIYALHNRCAHRGARVCAAERGNARAFTCPYHAWTFGTDGALQAVAHPKSYPPAFAFGDERNHLFRLPRVESYRGFVFASAAPAGSSLAEFLGPMTDAFDNLIDRAPDGEVELSEHSFRLYYRGNWKMHNENANDSFHPGFVHASSIAAAASSPAGSSRVDPDSLTWVQLESNRRTPKEWEEHYKVSFPQGHNYGAGVYNRGVLAPRINDPVRKEYRDRLAARMGEERASAILGLDRFNNLLYPNLNVNAQYQQLRIAHPVSVDKTLVISYCLRLKGAPDEMFHRAVRFMTNLGSPASMIYSDDAEVFDRCQRGLSEGGNEWLDFSRGYGNEQPSPDGGRISGASEHLMRDQFGAWLGYMTRETA